MLRAGVELDLERLSADLGVGDPAEGGGGDVPTDLDQRVGVEDVDPTEIATGQAAFCGDRTDDAGRADAVGVTDGNAVPRTGRDGIPLARTVRTVGLGARVDEVVATAVATAAGIPTTRCIVAAPLGTLGGERGCRLLRGNDAVVAGGQRQQRGGQLGRRQVLLRQVGRDGLAVVLEATRPTDAQSRLREPWPPCGQQRPLWVGGVICSRVVLV